MTKQVIKVRYSLILLLTFACFIGEIKNVVGIITVLLLHELGHIFFIKLFKGKVKQINFSLLGGMMDTEIDDLTTMQKVLIFCGWHFSKLDYTKCISFNKSI